VLVYKLKKLDLHYLYHLVASFSSTQSCFHKK